MSKSPINNNNNDIKRGVLGRRFSNFDGSFMRKINKDIEFDNKEFDNNNKLNFNKIDYIQKKKKFFFNK